METARSKAVQLTWARDRHQGQFENKLFSNGQGMSPDRPFMEELFRDEFLPAGIDGLG
jgi:hypothetical protein